MGIGCTARGYRRRQPARPTMAPMENRVAPAPFGWAEPLHFSQAVAAGELVFSSGQGGFGEDGQVVPGGFEPQLRQAFANLRASLEGAGASLESIVKLTVF